MARAQDAAINNAARNGEMNMNAWKEFDRWYSRFGHWVYESKADAEAAWKQWGISLLPKYPGPRPE